MTWDQRVKLDSMLRSQPPAPLRTIEEPTRHLPARHSSSGSTSHEHAADFGGPAASVREAADAGVRRRAGRSAAPHAPRPRC
jgi:hypothetical protein